MPDIDYDAEIRRTRATDSLTALEWLRSQNASAHFWQERVKVAAADGRTGRGPTLASAVLDCVLGGDREGTVLLPAGGPATAAIR